MIKVIAEIGWNHLGDMSLAKDFIKAAKMESKKNEK